MEPLAEQFLSLSSPPRSQRHCSTLKLSPGSSTPLGLLHAVPSALATSLLSFDSLEPWQSHYDTRLEIPGWWLAGEEGRGPCPSSSFPAALGQGVHNQLGEMEEHMATM